MNRILDELVKNSSSCFEEMAKQEEWKRINEELKDIAAKSDDEGVKKLRLIFNDEFEGMKEEMKRNEDELNGMDVNEIVNDVKKINKRVNMNGCKTYVFSNSKKKNISNELVTKYPECLLNVNMIDVDSRNSENEVEIDFRFNYLDEIVSYMGNEYDIDELNEIEFDKFCVELKEMNILFRMDIINKLCNDSNKYGIGWKNRCVVVNGKEYKMILNYMKLGAFQYNEETERIECVIDSKYEPIIQSFSTYLQDKSKGEELRFEIDRKLLNSFLDAYSLDMNNEAVQDFFYPIYSPFLKESIISEEKYDSYLKEWAGDYKWRLLYRASEHGYRAESFHEYCDDQGSTLVVIKSSGGWIFGGYTTQSWSGNGI